MVKWQANHFTLNQSLFRIRNEKSSGRRSATTHVGLITTGDSFIASEEKVAAIREHFPEVLAVEMEGAAIAQAAHAAGRPFMVIRAMSDTADHAANISFDEFIVEAGERSAQTLITFLKRLV